MRTAARIVVLTAALLTTPSLAQSMTYQGRLDSAGAPASGPHDFELRLFDAAVGGAQLGSTSTMSGVQVENGLFTLTPSVGPGLFTGADRYLEISVRPAGGGAYTTLSPRQLVTPAPLAFRSLNERWTPTGSTLSTDPGVTNVRINTPSSVFFDSVLTVGRATPPGALAGMYVNASDAGSIAYYGWATDNTSRAEARVHGADGRFELRLGSNIPVHINGAGLVGLGAAPAGTARLQVAGAASATDFQYAAPVVRRLVIPAAAFVPSNGSLASGVTYLNDRVAMSLATTVAALTAPVTLPDDATITGITAWAYDNSALDFSFSLFRANFAANGATLLASWSSAGASASPREFAFAGSLSDVVNTATSQYNVFVTHTDWEGTSNTALKAVVITYTASKPD
ncbi:MAG TPA: hypothetical protein VD971_09525 [Phycisphaerales bacterium]|nr:hypothetical protein [Phycisphaerales bacterium]